MSDPKDRGTEVVSATLAIVNTLGLHARAAAKFVNLVHQFKAKVTVSRQGMSVGGDSIMGLMMLSAGPGSSILVEAEGREAREVVDALADLVARRFDED